MSNALLAIRSVSKAYGATQALSDVSLEVRAGEIHAVVGENGAGKSTLINILSGIVLPDTGVIALDGERVSLDNPHQAQRSGIATVHQELSLVDQLSVAENVFASRVPTCFGFVRWSRLAEDTAAIFRSLAVEVDASAKAGDLPISARQLVEIAKALSLKARLLLFDEPTSALNANEKEALFALILRLKAQGMAVIYISHHLDEIMRLADRVTVLRDGRVVSTHLASEVTPQLLVRDMVGREVATARDDVAGAGAVALEIRGLTLRRRFSDVSFSIREGEIVALSGLLGSGRSALAATLAGLHRPDAGAMTWAGEKLELRSLRDAMRHGIGYVPGERKSEGLFLTLTMGENVVAASLPRVTRAGLFDRAAMIERAVSYIAALRIKTRGPGEICGALSGGNQQKVLLAKWLETSPRLLVIEEPTKGVDIAAKAEIHDVLRDLARSGVAILIVSSDLPEVLTLAHRVLVMHKGRLIADLPARATSEREITAAASGLMKEAA